MSDNDWETLETTIRRARIVKGSAHTDTNFLKIDVSGPRSYQNCLYLGTYRRKSAFDHFSVQSPEELKGKPVLAFYHSKVLQGI